MRYLLAGFLVLVFRIPGEMIAQAPPGYELVWQDEFEGEALDSTKWAHYGMGPRGLATNVPEAVTLHAGHLVITTERIGNLYTTGMVSSRTKFEQRFGYFECKAKMQTQKGHGSAFRLMPIFQGNFSNERNFHGVEIDVFEHLARKGDKVQHALQWDGYGRGSKSVRRLSKIRGLRHGYHVFALEWTPDYYAFYIDGHLVWKTDVAVSQVPQHLILSLEVGKWAGKIKKAKLPDSVYFEYVRVYKKT